MTMNTNQNQEIQTNNFPPRSTKHPKKQIEIKVDKKTVAKVVGGVGAVTIAGAIGYNAFTNNDSAMAVEKTEEPKTTLVSSANVNNINGKKVEKEAVEKETTPVVESKKVETTKPSQKEEVKSEVVKAAPKVETAAVVNTTTETEVKEIKTEKPSVEESKPATEVVVEEEVAEKNEVVEEAPVVEETEEVESQETVETPAEEDVIVADTDLEEEVEKEEVTEEVTDAIFEFKGTLLGLGDAAGHFQVEAEGEIHDFYAHRSEEAKATLENLSVGAEILISYTEGKQVTEILALEEARDAVEMTVKNFCTPMSIEVVENGFARTLPLLNDEVRNQIKHFGANAFVSVVVKNGIEYVKLVEYVTSFATGTFISHDAETVTFSVGGELVTYKLSEDLRGRDLAWEFGVGSEVDLEIVETNEGSFVERIN